MGIWLWVSYNKITFFPLFYLLKGGFYSYPVAVSHLLLNPRIRVYMGVCFGIMESRVRGSPKILNPRLQQPYTLKATQSKLARPQEGNSKHNVEACIIPLWLEFGYQGLAST